MARARARIRAIAQRTSRHRSAAASARMSTRLRGRLGAASERVQCTGVSPIRLGHLQEVNYRAVCDMGICNSELPK